MAARIHDRVRTNLARHIDPLVARRSAVLSRRWLRGLHLSEETSAAVDEAQRGLLADLTHAIRAGRFDADHTPEVAGLVEACLARVDESSSPDTVAAVCHAFEQLFQPRRQPVREPPEPIARVITDSFHRLYYNVSMRTWKDTWYRGVRTYKCPTDMWVYQELVNELQPSLVIETGTFRGGSALFLADRLETLGHGEVVTIDVDVQPGRPEHPRLTYLTGSSVGDDILAEIQRRLPPEGHVLVILDADHSRDHVAAELRAYAPLVTVGSYLVVEDTNVNGHPAPDYGPGPWEAAQAFLACDPGFEIDARCERYFLTQNPQGYLRKVR
ncbi:MAG: CmcI family methyltransferase [Jatrophihabitantaceae bacterium]